jgi:hypothetical protein
MTRAGAVDALVERMTARGRRPDGAIGPRLRLRD